MGADLYLYSVYNQNHDIYYPKFLEAVAERDRLTKLGDEAEAAEMQQLVSEYYEKMNESGYYRDSYNSTGFLRLLDLSYWHPTVAYQTYVRTADGYKTITDEEYELLSDDEKDDVVTGWGPAECQDMLELIAMAMKGGIFERNFMNEFGPKVIRKHQYIAQEEATPEAESEGWYKMFMGKHERLTALLRQAIELGEPIHCSV